MIERVPPPWQLTGSAYILLFRFSKGEVQADGFTPPETLATFAGGIGSIMLVDYHTSNVGPYRELLYIPGLFQVGESLYFRVTRIVVSTATSADNGRLNWGLPKETASFRITPDGDTTIFRASQAGTPFFHAELQPYGPGLPVDASWLPVRPALAQVRENAVYITRPTGEGTIRLARVTALWSDGQSFPPIPERKPLAALHISRFRLTFPPAHIRPLKRSSWVGEDARG